MDFELVFDLDISLAFISGDFVWRSEKRQRDAVK